MFGRRKPKPDYLDSPLFWWNRHDVFTLRHLLRHVLIMGGTGSGKARAAGQRSAARWFAAPTPH